MRIVLSKIVIERQSFRVEARIIYLASLFFRFSCMRYQHCFDYEETADT